MLNAAAAKPKTAGEEEASAPLAWKHHATMALPELKLWVASLPLFELEVEQQAGRYFATVRPKNNVLTVLKAAAPVDTLEAGQRLALRLAVEVLREELASLAPEECASSLQDMQALAAILQRIDRTATQLDSSRITQKLTDHSLAGIHLTAAIRVQRGQLHLRVDRVASGEPPTCPAAPDVPGGAHAAQGVAS